MLLDGWLTNVYCRFAVLLVTSYFSGLFRGTANGYSSIAAMAHAMTFAKQIEEQREYCLWTGYNRSALNFKEQEVPIAVIFTIDHNLTPRQLESVLDVYHALACLLPEDSDRLYAVVAHLPKNPKLYFGKLLNIRKLHRSFEEAGQATGDLGARATNPCYLVEQTINLLKDWLSKAFFFEKVAKHIIFVNHHIDSCVIPRYFHTLYYKDGQPHRWFVDKIILNVTNFGKPLQYRLETSRDIRIRLEGNKDRSVLEGSRLRLPIALSQKNHLLFNGSRLKKSLTEFLREILLESMVADAVFSMDLKNKWIKYDFNDFKKHSRRISTFESWTWLLNFLRIIFFIVGAFILLITTCALCGFACMLSTIVRDDYYHRRQARQREEDLRNLEQRFRNAGIDINLNRFDPSPQWDRESNSETNTAIERLSTRSEVDSTQASSVPGDGTFLNTAVPSLSQDEAAMYNNDEADEEVQETMLSTARSPTEFHSAINL